MTETIPALPAAPLPALEHASASPEPPSPTGEEYGSLALGRNRGKRGALLSAPPTRLVKYGQGLWRQRSLAQAYYEARLALGQRMYRSGIDDGLLGVQLRDLEIRICRSRATQAPSKALKLQREKLLLQLADAALAEEGPLPGADDEYQQARKVEAALAEMQPA
jgi:hypothetical protein